MIKQENLLSGLKQNNKEAIDYIYSSCFHIVRSHILKNSGSQENAEDIFQEAIVVLYQNVSLKLNFVLTCSISTYLFEVSKRLWLKHLQKNGNTIYIDNTQDNYLFDKTYQVPEDLDEHEAFNLKTKSLNIALQNLGEPCVSIIKAYYNDNKSMSDISEIFGYTNEKNAKNQKYKCLVRLKKLFLNTMPNTKS